MFPVVVVWSYYADGVAIRYILPVLRMTLYFHTMGPVSGRARRCVVSWVAVPVGVAASERGLGAGRCGPLARWLGRQVCWACWGGRGRVGRALDVRRLDSAGDGGARFAVCFMLV